jgi:N-acyl-phosphatidylethanolamine-hydrolysing phospholipase D
MNLRFRSRRSLFDTNKALWGGYVVKNSNYKFYFAGDTGYTDEINIFKQIGEQYGPFDLSAIPIGAYEPRWMMEAQHVSPDEAVRIHLDTQSKQSIGIHWGTWALANEYFLEPREKLAQAVKTNRLHPNCFITVQHGEIVHIPKHD